jgi:hypothetical protein
MCPERTLELMATPAGLSGSNNINGLQCQTCARVTFDPQRLSGALANQPLQSDGAVVIYYRHQ